MEVTIPADAENKNVGFIFMRCSTSDGVFHRSWDKKLKDDVLKGEEQDEIDRSFSIMLGAHLVLLRPAMHLSKMQLLQLHNGILVNCW